MLKKLWTIFKRPLVMLTDLKTMCHWYSGLSSCICNLPLRKYASHSLKDRKSWHDWHVECLSWQSCCSAHSLSVSEAVQCPWFGLKGTSELWLFDQSCLFPSWKLLDTVLCTLTAVINSLCFECQCEPHMWLHFFPFCSARQGKHTRDALI